MREKREGGGRIRSPAVAWAGVVRGGPATRAAAAVVAPLRSSVEAKEQGKRRGEARDPVAPHLGPRWLVGGPPQRRVAAGRETRSGGATELGERGLEVAEVVVGRRSGAGSLYMASKAVARPGQVAVRRAVRGALMASGVATRRRGRRGSHR